MRTSIVLALAAIAGTAQALPQPQNSATTTVSLPATFSTPVFSVSNTFTPITTFETPKDTKPTAISGTGIFGTPYTFTYSVPATAVGTISSSGLDESLAAAGYPTSQGDLSAPTQNLQIVGKAGALVGRNMAPVWSFGGFVAVAAGAGAAMLMI
ncbi:unnamed protein product [Tilletia controversa]|uniref:Protein PBN1 n=3 Tax=Tilletia TaxID=13289 RepID=A0A8X7MSY3_9BASI|nr:hypothetical protein CF336_g4367 [Tilletia laevis]KAE8196181.1 hypothetical protein CF328_g4213 [Tilletia controversa]KAE8259926.1 hypothetical protein A4X03_0g3956 [Tilletia caries]KAE8201279.1 hypothetical protein CF335_g3777 [Tilletia laevis]KAE8246991.1 hypothetical protein A4X06_0g4777 [Tilletia controversa]